MRKLRLRKAKELAQATQRMGGRERCEALSCLSWPSLISLPWSLFTPNPYLCPSHNAASHIWKCCQCYSHRKIQKRYFFLLKKDIEKKIQVNPYSSFRTIHSLKQTKNGFWIHSNTYCRKNEKPHFFVDRLTWHVPHPTPAPPLYSCWCQSSLPHALFSN